ncbi:MAG: hypothetical protein AAGC47_00630 [Bacteroidota bacterium]
MNKRVFHPNHVFLAFSVGMFLLLSAMCTSLKGQKFYEVVYSESSKDIPTANEIEAGQDSIAFEKELNNLKSALNSAGYLTAGIDSISNSRNGDLSKIYVYVGPKFKWGIIRGEELSEETLSKIGFRNKLYYGESFSSKQLAQLAKRLLDEAENTGYPFAEVYFENPEINGDSIEAKLQFQKGEFFSVDSLIIKGDLKTNRKYIENYLGYKKGQPYNQAQLRSIPSRINEIPFIQSIKPYEVGMRPNKADVYLYLKPKKSSNFDGILGVLPDPVTGEILFTGDIKLNLLNSFKKGETINIEWQRLQTQTSQLDLQFKYPFLFNTPIGIDFNFNLYRRDTTFSQNRVNAGIEYYFLGNNRVRAFFENQGANTIGNDEFVSNDLVDSRTNLFGLGAFISDLDYRFNPRKGYLIDISVAAGQKKITSELDDDQEQETDIYNLNLNASTYVPIFKRSAIHFRVQGGLFLNANMFRNEIYRIGGLRTLRGFDEQAIFASGYSIGTIEYRFILEQNSNLFLFFDQAYYEDQSREDNLSDNPFGFGGGINFETGAGVFSLTYALGKQFDNNISIRGGKIHFGFISFF